MRVSQQPTLPSTATATSDAWCGSHATPPQKPTSPHAICAPATSAAPEPSGRSVYVRMDASSTLTRLAAASPPLPPLRAPTPLSSGAGAHATARTRADSPGSCASGTRSLGGTPAPPARRRASSSPPPLSGRSGMRHTVVRSPGSAFCVVATTEASCGQGASATTSPGWP